MYKRQVQGRVTAAGRPAGLFDDVVGRGFVLLTTEPPESLLTAGDRAWLADLGGHAVRVLAATGEEPPAGAVADTDGVYLPYLAAAGAVAVLVRPDFYVYGAAADRTELAALLGALRTDLTA